MTHTKHTPGPWTHRDSAHNGAFEVNGADSKTFVVADVFAYLQYAGRAEANARLIAAAPELLQIAKWILAAKMDYGEPLVEADYQALEVAIAKAEETNG